MKQKKCIILSRVSTMQQDLEQQTEQLFEDAIHYGYDRKNIILIEDKESAIKLEESERNGLNTMKEYIESDHSIDCVFIWEITRVSRQLQMLYSIRDYLQEHHVQLICHTPQFTLFNDDWTISQTSNMVFAMFAVIAESEMQVKKQRMIRGKIKRMQEGKYIGGTLSYGYTIDNPKDKNIIIDEQQSQVIKKIFNLYTETDMSGRTIAKELLQTGELWHDSVECAYAFVTVVLRNPVYIGKSSVTKGHSKPKHGMVYPAFITEEQFNKARAKAESKNNNLKKRGEYNTDSVMYAKGIIFYEHDGIESRMSAIKPHVIYSYRLHENGQNIGLSVNMNMLDSFCWYCAKKNRLFNSSKTVGEIRKELNDEKKTLMKKILNSERQIADLNNQIDIIETRIIKGRLSQSKGDAMEDELISKINDLKSKQDKWKYKVIQIDEQLNQANTTTYKKDLNKVTDEEEINKIVKEEINKVVINSFENINHNIGIYVTTVEYKNGRTEQYKLLNSNYRKELYDMNDNQIADFEFTKRFEKIRAKKK